MHAKCETLARQSDVDRSALVIAELRRRGSHTAGATDREDDAVENIKTQLSATGFHSLWGCVRLVVVRKASSPAPVPTRAHLAHEARHTRGSQQTALARMVPA